MNLLLLIGLDALGLLLIGVAANLLYVEGREAWRLFVPLTMVGLAILAGATISLVGASA